MAIRVVTEDAPIIRVTGVASAPVSSPIGAVNTVNVSQSNQIVKVPTTGSALIEIQPVGSAEVQVSNPVVRPFKAIIYQGPKGDPGVSSEGSSVLTSDLTVTEVQGSAQSETVYPTLTNIEDIVRDMLTEFVVPTVSLTDVTLGYTSQGNFIEYDRNQFDISEEVLFDSLTFTLNSKENRYPNFNLPIYFSVRRSGSQFDLSMFPQLFPNESNSEYDDYINFGGSFSQSPRIDVKQGLGVGKIKSNFPYTKNGDDLYYSNDEYVFYVGKSIKCYTSVASDTRASNIGNVLGTYANVYDPENSNLLTQNLQVDANELKASIFVHDFETEEREVIISFTPGSQSVADKNRFLIIELPNEFVIDEVAATTAGSGVYSLNDSIVYLGNNFGDDIGTPYTVNGQHVKYYRSRIPGAFDGKIKLDLKIKLDN